MSKTGKALITAAAMYLAGSTFALEARDVKRACDKAGNWLIEQFDLKEKVFGKGEQAKDVMTVAMVVTALCNHPRDYKETSGPFISEPVKYILGQVTEDGTFKDAGRNRTEAAAWVSLALASTANEKHRALCGTLKQAKGGELEAGTGKLTADLDGKSLRQTYAQVRSLVLGGKKEIDVDGKTVKWGETLAESLMKLQQKNGSFGDDIQVNALALSILNVCYKAMR